MKKINYVLLLCASLFATSGVANENTTNDAVFTEEELIVTDCGEMSDAIACGDIELSEEELEALEKAVTQ